jgi:hypothetical protein
MEAPVSVDAQVVFDGLTAVTGIQHPDALYQEELDAVRQDTRLGDRLAIKSTPTFFVNGVALGTVSVESFRWAVLHELSVAAPTSKVPCTEPGVACASQS